MEKLKQNVQRNVIGGILYLNTWLWALSSSINIDGIVFANWLLAIGSVLIIIYSIINEDDQLETKEAKIFIRVIALILFFTNLIYVFNMEISRMNILAAIIFVTVIILTVLYSKKYGIDYDEMNSNWGFSSLNGHLAKGEMFSIVLKKAYDNKITYNLRLLTPYREGTGNCRLNSLTLWLKLSR